MQAPPKVARAYCSLECRTSRRMSAVRGNVRTLGGMYRSTRDVAWHAPNFLNLLAGLRASRLRRAATGHCIGCAVAPWNVALCSTVRA